MIEYVVEISDVSYAYNGETVIRDVFLNIRKGDFLAVIGPNGGGKTTLIKLMLGILKPQKGTISVFGTQPKQAAPRIGYVPQDIHINRGFPISVEDVVRMGRIRGGGGWRPFSGKDMASVQKALEQVEMWDLQSRRPYPVRNQ